MGTILLVVGDDSALTLGDPIVRDRLINNHGHTVIFASDEDAEVADSNYDGFMVSDSCSSGTIGNKYGTIPKPGIWMESGAWAGVGLGSTQQINSQTIWTIPAASDLSAGLSGNQTIYSSAQTQAMLLTGGDGEQRIAHQPSVPSRATYVAYEAGAALTNGPAPARRIALGMLNGAVPVLTAAGLSLLDAAITYAFPPPPPSNTPPGFFLSYM